MRLCDQNYIGTSCSGRNCAHFEYPQCYVTSYKINFPVCPTYPCFLTFPQKNQGKTKSNQIITSLLVLHTSRPTNNGVTR